MIQSPQRAVEVFKAEFDAAWEYGALFVPVWHPFLSGRLSRWHEVSKLIEYMMAKGDVWFARMDEIAAHVQRSVATGSYTPRVDRLPYYQGPVKAHQLSGEAAIDGWSLFCRNEACFPFIK
ncbi:hypothetical protein ACQKP5_23450 [Pseudomonas vancouverensis]|uniref:hypothetical protein n=1 Tax=Pseudomonas vancouverensis TaxID=95300 RepID=UPI003D05297D